jgi:hypothetical protein
MFIKRFSNINEGKSEYQDLIPEIEDYFLHLTDAGYRINILQRGYADSDDETVNSYYKEPSEGKIPRYEITITSNESKDKNLVDEVFSINKRLSNRFHVDYTVDINVIKYDNDTYVVPREKLGPFFKYECRFTIAPKDIKITKSDRFTKLFNLLKSDRYKINDKDSSKINAVKTMGLSSKLKYVEAISARRAKIESEVESTSNKISELLNIKFQKKPGYPTQQKYNRKTGRVSSNNLLPSYLEYKSNDFNIIIKRTMASVIVSYEE